MTLPFLTSRPQIIMIVLVAVIIIMIIGVSAVRCADREDGRWFVQPHDVLGVRGRVLLAVHEGDQRPALPLTLGLHLLGQEAVVAQEEAPLAARYPGGCARGHRAPSGHLHSGHDHRDPRVGGPKALRPVQQGPHPQTEPDHRQRRRSLRKSENNHRQGKTGWLDL